MFLKHCSISPQRLPPLLYLVMMETVFPQTSAIGIKPSLLMKNMFIGGPLHIESLTRGFYKVGVFRTGGSLVIRCHSGEPLIPGHDVDIKCRLYCPEWKSVQLNSFRQVPFCLIVPTSSALLCSNTEQRQGCFTRSLLALILFYMHL